MKVFEKLYFKFGCFLKEKYKKNNENNETIISYIIQFFWKSIKCGNTYLK